ncbi:transporter substrate-binding domain-containing protein [Vannielia litorea]|uniref:transporter substrate-binding domain-containing protein n=1 Tax=Vannielia litorea TaxID=1217970 RepID=UPI001C976888|nr:transporter substrate-binding domain-containing protein [Vannielia litorea]MBY6046422.1 transporter substrate-binding domain-containing protein [Vannielia litorea]MBY6073835.1 transporter substrate-binding domain-containing protein [Vannielia litorea]
MALRLALALVAAGLGASAGAAAQEVRIGTEGAFPPYTYRDRAGELRGFDIELGNEICRRSGLDCAWVVNDWESLLPNLVAGKYDVAMAGMAVTTERAKMVAFSLGYEVGSNAASAVLMQTGASTSDAPHVAVQRATIHEDWARSMGYRVSTYPSLVAAVEALFDGRVDEVVGPQAFLEGVARNGGGRVEIAELFGIPSGDTAAAFRKEDRALRETFDSAIAEMLADGSISAMAEKWFQAGDGTE